MRASSDDNARDSHTSGDAHRAAPSAPTCLAFWVLVCLYMKQEPNPFIGCDFIFLSPTHKRTERRAPEWGSEFTSKDAALQEGDPEETAARLNAK
jgi:hypothetical protein